jgi:hypothetical protein
VRRHALDEAVQRIKNRVIERGLDDVVVIQQAVVQA